MEWLSTHFQVIIAVLLVLSEAAAALTQLFFPSNQGVTGVIAGIIKFLQGMQNPPSK